MIDLTSILYYLLYIFISFVIVRIFMERWLLRAYRLTRNIPGPFHYPIIGNVLSLWGDIENVFKLVHDVYVPRYKDIYKFTCWDYVGINLLNPEDVEIILTKNAKTSKSFIYSFLHPWLRTGLLTSGGEKWQNRRKILTPSFHFNILQQFTTVLTEQSNATVKTLDNYENEQVLNLTPFLTEFTLSSLCETTMGVKINPKSKTILEYKAAIIRYGQILEYRLFKPWLYSNFIFDYLSPLGEEARKLEKVLHKFTSDIIDERIKNWDESVIKNINISASGKQRLAMLDFLIQQFKEGNIDYEGIKEEVDTFMFEGHDTTTSGLLFSLFMLANHRDVQDKVYEELQEIFNDSDRLPTYQDLQNMQYLERFIKEVIRLYPPVHFISRKADEDIQLSKYLIPKDALLHIHIYDIHRNPKYWPNPTKFDPDRFLIENTMNRHPFAFIPFSGGQRNCIGQRFAMLEMKSFISTLLRKYKLEAVDTPDNVVILPDFVLRPKQDIKVILKKRQTD